MRHQKTWPAFEGARNFRDIGGFVLPDGRRMKSGMVYRSDNLSKLSVKDWELIREFGIKSIIDLRTPNECKSQAYKLANHWGIQRIPVPILSEEKDLSRWEFFCFLLKEGRKLNYEQYMEQFYQRLAFARTEQIRTVFTLLADASSLPALVHCTGGKDRTGFIAALLQLLAGVPEELVVEDYLASNELIAFRMKKLERAIRVMSLGQIAPEQIRPMLEVRREYLEAVLDEVFRRCGSIETYLTSACGVAGRDIARLREILVL